MSDNHHEKQIENPPLGRRDVNSGDTRKAGYEVGYKRPPLHTRFKPGQSGNPKGRPAGRANHKTAIDRVMNEKVSVREGEKTRHITKFEAMLQAQTYGAAGFETTERDTAATICRTLDRRLLGIGTRLIAMPYDTLVRRGAAYRRTAGQSPPYLNSAKGNRSYLFVYNSSLLPLAGRLRSKLHRKFLKIQSLLL